MARHARTPTPSWNIRQGVNSWCVLRTCVRRCVYDGCRRSPEGRHSPPRTPRRSAVGQRGWSICAGRTRHRCRTAWCQGRWWLHTQKRGYIFPFREHVAELDVHQHNQPVTHRSRARETESRQWWRTCGSGEHSWPELSRGMASRTCRCLIGTAAGRRRGWGTRGRQKTDAGSAHRTSPRRRPLSTRGRS